MKNLVDLFSDIKISTNLEDLICYSYDASRIEKVPSAIVWPSTTEDVVRIMKYAYENNIPVVPRGAGTGTTAGAVPTEGSIVMSFERMRKILEIDTDNLNVVCEPGVINGRLQRELEWRGYFYPPDPASMDFCTIGGNVAENAGGPRAIKYGVTRDYVMEIETVLPNGKIMNVGVKTVKGVVGYDIARLLVGSEGTLAIFTKIRLKILPLPEDVITLLATFDKLSSAGEVVKQILSKGILPRTLEFMDSESIIAVERYRPTGLPERAEALLLIELDGHLSAVKRDAEKIVDICNKFGGDVKVAEDENARRSLWAARRSVSPALYHLKPTKINEDIVVPRSKITQMLVFLRELSERNNIKIVNFGHAGDGNIHVNIMVDSNNKEEFEKGKSLVSEIFSFTLELGGTISGEHGVGLTKLPYINMELSKTQSQIMKSIKNIFDPTNILNPGKIFPED
jgi:glycolate oxidase